MQSVEMKADASLIEQLRAGYWQLASKGAPLALQGGASGAPTPSARLPLQRGRATPPGVARQSPAGLYKARPTPLPGQNHASKMFHAPQHQLITGLRRKWLESDRP